VGQCDTHAAATERGQRRSGRLCMFRDQQAQPAPRSARRGRWESRSRSITRRASRSASSVSASWAARSWACTSSARGSRRQPSCNTARAAIPKSPHYFDQARLYSETKFKPAWFYKDEVESHTVTKYHPGEENGAAGHGQKRLSRECGSREVGRRLIRRIGLSHFSTHRTKNTIHLTRTLPTNVTRSLAFGRNSSPTTQCAVAGARVESAIRQTWPRGAKGPSPPAVFA
jgi:hypothetical protein